ncbi:MAG: class I SAM-dependent methyltransferase [Acidobacteriaceae bacterium]|nr:class I SAM-dependent methyltransferase [Acidobacteriaceae bacterium]
MAQIEHVSDTALMVAACRALETDRPDGFVHDPFAASLAGEKGMAIARDASKIEWMCFGVGIRSRFIDEFLTRALLQGTIRTVVNLGAGLDTRPWRLHLPAGLRWIEVDFEDMLEYKADRLRAQQPRCILERMAADLTLPGDRERVFRAVGDAPTLMITEGLLMYLPRQALVALSSEAAATSRVRWWILDVSSTELMQRAHGDLIRDIESVRAEDHLTGREIIDVALSQGWKIERFCSYTRDAVRIAQDRIMKLAATERLPEPPPEDDPSGVYLFTRDS